MPDTRSFSALRKPFYSYPSSEFPSSWGFSTAVIPTTQAAPGSTAHAPANFGLRADRGSGWLVTGT